MVRRKRLVLLSAGVLLLAACGQAAGPMPSPSSTAPPPRLIPFTGEPPIWPITNEEFDRIVGGVMALYFPDSWEPYAPATAACASLEGTRPEGDLIGGNAAVEACLRPYLERLGVGARALDLFFATGILVWDAPRTGPFWNAYASDYDLFGSEAITPDYLVTPDGIFDVPDQLGPVPPAAWMPLVDARDAALAVPEMDDIRAAYGEEFGTAAAEVGFWPYGETIDLATPRGTADGWEIPFEWRLLGCHLCTTPIVGRFTIEATAGGTIVGARFDGLCYDRRILRFLPDAFTDLGDFGQPACGALLR